MDLDQKFSFQTRMTSPKLTDYEETYSSFKWDEESDFFGELSSSIGLNIANEAVDKHAEGVLRDAIDNRFIRKDFSKQDFTYTSLQKESAKFANVLDHFSVRKGEKRFIFF